MDFFIVILIIAIVVIGGIVAIVPKRYSRTTLFWATANVIALSLFAFSTTSMYKHFEIKGMWEATTSIFGLLGILLTAGAAFATVAAIISYISVNDKLKRAESELGNINNFVKNSNEMKKKFKDLVESEEINRTTVIESELEKQVNELEQYKTSYENSDLNNSENHKKYISSAKMIVEMNDIPFYIKLKTNAILNDENANRIKQERKFDNAYYLYQKSAEYWKLLYLNDNQDNSLNNYVTSLLNCAYCLNETNQEEHDKKISIYKEVIQIYKYGGLKQDAMTFNNLGNIILNKGVLTKKREEKLHLLDQAIANYKKAISIEMNNPHTFNVLGSALAYKAENIKTQREVLNSLKKAISNYTKAIQLNHNYLSAYKNLKIIIQNGLNILKKNNTLLKAFLQHAQSSLNEIKVLEKNEECKAKFNEIVKLVNDELDKLNTNTSGNSK